MESLNVAEPTPNRKTYVSIVVAMTGAIMFGVDCTNFGATQGFPDFLDTFCVGVFDQHGESCATAVPEHKVSYQKNFGYFQVFCMLGNVLMVAGACVGAVMLAPTIATKLGRRPCISFGAFTTFLGTAMSALSFGNIYIFEISRFLTGFGVGVCCYALPMYNSEMATAKIRGRTGSLFQFFTVLGGVVATFSTLLYKNWQFGMLLPGIFGLLVSLAIWFVPESPRWVMKNKGFEAGVATLRRIRDGDVTAEARAIHEALAAEATEPKITMMEACGNSNLRKRVIIACCLQAAQQMSGVNAFLGYASTLFGACGIKNPFVFNTVWNLIFVVGIMCGIMLIDSPKGGRRSQLLAATVLMGPSLVVSGGLLALPKDAIPSWVVPIFLCVYAFGFQFAWGMIPWVYPSEIFSNREREVAMGFAVGFQYLLNTFIDFIAPILIAWNIPMTLGIFGVFNIANFVFVYLCIKETKGIPLEKVPELFGDTSGLAAKEATLA